MKILFVCLGNICRSPLAEGIAKDLAQKKGLDIVVDSAGTSRYHIGEPPCDYSIKVAKENGIDISNLRAREVTKADKDKFDLIIALDRNNQKDLAKIGINAKLLGEYAGYKAIDVPDPYYFKSYDEGIKEVFIMIKNCVEDLLEDLV